ncbi:PHD finger protein 14 isoform X2 [Cryptotermes secundus]|uniref:PHD finger protein 14 isoform X2 n=1 Tax=Cryptotermes secundus TaxID=105785 RepID=UPI000CD7CA0B|nr:PHD finger protein 14 isoform X2 [Cryptotermes secundus]
MSGFERDPKKRRVKPVGPAHQSLLDFDLGESSDDSDFRIEDHFEESDDDSIDSDDDGGTKDDANEDEDDDDDDDEDEDDNEDDDDDAEDSEDSAGEILPDVKHPVTLQQNVTIGDVIQQAKQRQAETKHQFDLKEAVKVLICCGCLGDRSDDANEIVECDGCGVTVHEGCYGVSDTASVSSTISSCSTEPWFCEACRAGVTNPTCELCPNSGGIFKETDVGKWVHLVCALYVPGVAFGEVDKLSSVTLFEMPYSKWGAKTCCLCEDARFSRTGVCIGCDAGMCRTFFHVTCAQREGLLSEAHSEEVDQADPFYAHCKMHTDKALMRRRRRNWLALQLRTKQRQIEYQQVGHSNTTEQLRIQRKLAKYRQKYLSHKTSRIPPWVPTQKMPRLLTTSASAYRKLLHKAELMGIDTQALEIQEAQVAALVDVRKKWHIPPAFSVEFIGYYLDRNVRLTSMKRKLEDLLEVNNQLQDEQQTLRHKYDQLLKENADLSRTSITLKQIVHKYHSAILHICPSKDLPAIDELGKPPPRVLAVSPTGFASRPQTGRSEGRLPNQRSEAGPIPLNECGICHQTKDQHLLAKCDTCHLFYHLGCLNPPLTRMPKKTKLMGWQCSECDKESSGSDFEVVDTEAPRRLRHNKEAEKPLTPLTPRVTIKPIEPQPVGPPRPVFTIRGAGSPTATVTSPLVLNCNVVGVTSNSVEHQGQRQSKKRRREKHHRYSPDLQGVSPSKEHKRKRKRKSLDVENPNVQETPRIRIKIKPIPMPVGEGASSSGPQMFVATSSTETISTPSPIVARARTSSGRVSSGNKKAKDTDIMTKCDVCSAPGSNENLVRCDECMKCFHFTCLDPPVKKTPKRRGYSWHCADCDPTETDSDN